MTLFIRELKGNRRSFVIWTSCIIILTILFMAMYPTFADQGDALNDMLSAFPPEMMQMFGMSSIDFSQSMDYYAYVFQYLLLAAMIQFMILGGSLVSREEDSGTINFLYAKPISRHAIVRIKFLAGLAGIAVFFILYTSAALFVLSAVGKTPLDAGRVFLFSGAIALGQLMMLGIGMLLSMFITRARAIMSAAIGVVLLFYVLSMFININQELDALKYLTPFAYFDAQNMLHSGSIDFVYVILSVGIAAVCFFCSMAIFQRKDLKC